MNRGPNIVVFGCILVAAIVLYATDQRLLKAITPVNYESVNWEDTIPRLRPVLKRAFPRERIEEHYPIRIVQTADITGDGIPEALVYLGTGGAATDEVTVMRMQGDRPVVALFRRADGKVSPIPSCRVLQLSGPQ